MGGKAAETKSPQPETESKNTKNMRNTEGKQIAKYRKKKSATLCIKGHHEKIRAKDMKRNMHHAGHATSARR